MPGRLQVVGRAPADALDGAHNPSGVAALAAALPDVVGERPLVAVVSMLDDKDAAGMLRALLPARAGAVFTRLRQPARAVARPRSLARRPARRRRPLEIEPRPARARVERARELAGETAPCVATGSIYLVADLLAEPGRRRASRAVNDRGPGVLRDDRARRGVVVALVILVFFALGYVFGRLFL